MWKSNTLPTGPFGQTFRRRVVKSAISHGRNRSDCDRNRNHTWRDSFLLFCSSSVSEDCRLRVASQRSQKKSITALQILNSKVPFARAIGVQDDQSA